MTSKLINDNLKALREWRVWLHLGMADIRSKFAQSIVGPMWILLNLALWIGGIGVIYAALFHQKLEDFLPHLAVGFVVWTYLSQTITDGGNAFVFAEGYIKQFTYPKQIYVLRTLVTAAVPLLIGFLVCAAVLLWLGKPWGLGMLWAIPGLFVIWVASFIHGTIMAYLGARFRDVSHGMTALLQVLFFVTPVFFTIEVLEKRGLDFVYAYNPLYYLIEVVRYPLVKLQAAPLEIYTATGVYLLLAGAFAALVAQKLDRRVVYLL